MNISTLDCITKVNLHSSHFLISLLLIHLQQNACSRYRLTIQHFETLRHWFNFTCANIPGGQTSSCQSRGKELSVWVLPPKNKNKMNIFRRLVIIAFHYHRHPHTTQYVSLSRDTVDSVPHLHSGRSCRRCPLWRGSWLRC